MIELGYAAARRLQKLGLWPRGSLGRRVLVRLTGNRYSVQFEGMAISGSLLDHFHYLRQLPSGGLHPFHLQLFKKALAPGMVVVDCGAHIGPYTVLAARAVGPNGTVVALEPEASNVQALRSNLEANNVAERVEVIDAAASDRQGTVRLYVMEDRASRARSPWESCLSSLVPRAGTAPIEVRCVTLDEVLAGRRIDIAKIDVEGAERLVIDGAGETLARSAGATLFIECHPAELERSGTNMPEWLATLRDRGKLELIDESRERVVPMDDRELRRLVTDRPLAFNLRWTVGVPDATSP